MQLKIGQQFPVSAEGRDAANNVAPFETPVYAVTPPELGVFEVDTVNPVAGVFKAGLPGSGQLTLLADGIVGTGERTISGVLDITVLPGDAVSVVLNAGPVTDTPAS